MPGRPPSAHVPHRLSTSPALCPCGHAASFRRRASSFVRGAWSSAALCLAAVPCVCARCVRRAGWRARAWCCLVVAAAVRLLLPPAAAACALRLSRCRACLPRRGLWWPGACGVLAAGVRARRAACTGCVPRSREAAGRALAAELSAIRRASGEETPRASWCRRGSSTTMPKKFAWRGPCLREVAASSLTPQCSATACRACSRWPRADESGVQWSVCSRETPLVGRKRLL